jgi:hypothetical protein
MKNPNGKLSLDKLAAYQIKVPGEFDEGWLSLYETVTVAVERNGSGQPITSITSSFDQAALHGLLRHLYFLGLPLISVIWLGGS